MNTNKRGNKNFILFIIKKLSAFVIITVAVINIIAWKYSKVALINFNYEINPDATMKIVTALGFLLLGISQFKIKRWMQICLLSLGLILQLLQLTQPLLPFEIKSGSPITIALFIISFTELLFHKVSTNYKYAIILNSLVYTITLFTLYQFVLNPLDLVAIPGFESISWNTAVLFYINVITSSKQILKASIINNFTTVESAPSNINPFKYFPLYFEFPVLLIITTSLLIHFNIVNTNYAVFILLFLLNLATIASATIFTSKFIKLFKIIIATQKEVRYKNIKLIEKNKYLEDFASITSHNLKEPVIALNNLIEFKNNEAYKNKISTEEIDMMVSDNIKNLSQSIDTINRFLNAIRKGETQNFEYITISKAIASQQKIVTDYIENEIVETKVNLEEDLIFPKVYIESIFYNLFSNAYKYRSTNRALLIKINSSYVNNNYIVTFEDNGLGIDLNKHGKDIFKPNKRFHKTNMPSSGFGLYFTKMHVEKLDGTIDLYSETDKGTLITITFNKDNYESSHN